MSMPDTPQLSQITSIPNLISILRLFLIPVLIWQTVTENWITATIIAAFLGFTDYLDGYIARRFQQSTPLGKILDPLVDRFFVISVLGALVAIDLLSIFLAGFILARDLTVLLMRYVLKRDLQIQVIYLGKMGTWMLYVSFAVMYLSQLLSSLLVLHFAVAGAVWGAILYWLAGFAYISNRIQDRL